MPRQEEKHFSKKVTTTSSSSSNSPGHHEKHMSEKVSLSSDKPMSTTIVLCKSLIRVEGVLTLEGSSEDGKGAIQTDRGKIVVDNPGKFVITPKACGAGLNIREMTIAEVATFSKDVKPEELSHVQL